jgi:hypothetical protein
METKAFKIEAKFSLCCERAFKTKMIDFRWAENDLENCSVTMATILYGNVKRKN